MKGKVPLLGLFFLKHHFKHVLVLKVLITVLNSLSWDQVRGE